jgi:hypothetical protein
MVVLRRTWVQKKASLLVVSGQDNYDFAGKFMKSLAEDVAFVPSGPQGHNKLPQKRNSK